MILLFISIILCEDKCSIGSSMCSNNMLSICDENGHWVTTDCPDDTECNTQNNSMACLPNTKEKSKQTNKNNDDDSMMKQLLKLTKDKEFVKRLKNELQKDKEDPDSDKEDSDSSSEDKDSKSEVEEEDSEKESAPKQKKKQKNGKKNSKKEKVPQKNKKNLKQAGKDKPSKNKNMIKVVKNNNPKRTDDKKNDQQKIKTLTYHKMNQALKDPVTVTVYKTVVQKDNSIQSNQHKNNDKEISSSADPYKFAIPGTAKVNINLFTRPTEENKDNKIITYEIDPNKKSSNGNIQNHSSGSNGQNSSSSGSNSKPSGNESNGQNPSSSGSNSKPSVNGSNGQTPSRSGSNTKPYSSSSGGNNQPAKSGGNNQPAKSGGNNQPAKSGGNNQPAKSGGNNQGSNSTENSKPSTGNKNNQNSSSGGSNNSSKSNDNQQKSSDSKTSKDTNNKDSSSSNQSSKSSGGGGGNVTSDQINEAMGTMGYSPKPEYLDAVVKITNEEISDLNMAAMFLAQLAHESGGFQHMEEVDCAGSTKCADQYGGSEGAPGKSYHGRGFIQLSWPANYKEAGEGLGMGDQLFENPDMILEDPELGAKVSYWFWKTRVETAPGVSEYKFGATTKAINGALECTGSNIEQSKKRWDMYKAIAGTLGITDLASEDGCY